MVVDNRVTVHYKLLAVNDPNNPEEIRHYSCSECDDIVFNINIHAQVAHKTLQYDVDVEEPEVSEPTGEPFHPCGVLGCTFAPHDSGPHSWEVDTSAEVGGP